MMYQLIRLHTFYLNLWNGNIDDLIQSSRFQSTYGVYQIQQLKHRLCMLLYHAPANHRSCELYTQVRQSHGFLVRWFVCGRVGHMTKDCWYKDTSKGSTPNSKGKERKGKGKGKNSVNEVTTPTESTVAPSHKPPPVRSRESPRMTLGTVLSLWMKTKMRVRSWIHLGCNPAQRTIPSVQGMVCWARFGRQLRGRTCVFATRLRMDCHRTKQESPSGISEWTQAETLW